MDDPKAGSFHVTKYLSPVTFVQVSWIVFILVLGILGLIQFVDVYFLNFLAFAIAITIGGVVLLIALIVVVCCCGRPRVRQGLGQRRDATVMGMAFLIFTAVAAVLFWAYYAKYGSSGDRARIGYLAFTQIQFALVLFVAPLPLWIYVGFLGWVSAVEPRIDIRLPGPPAMVTGSGSLPQGPAHAAAGADKAIKKWV
jgi:uncharacterized membrane protein